jgi:ferrous iron transport protein A
MNGQETDVHAPSPLRVLSSVPEGQRVRIAHVQAGRGLTARLAAMGLLPNVEMTVIKNVRPGPFIVSLCDSKVILGRGMAEKIVVF